MLDRFRNCWDETLRVSGKNKKLSKERELLKGLLQKYPENRLKPSEAL